MVLDVRESWEIQTASVQADGFVLRAIPMQEIPARLGELDADQPVACLCHHGARSQRVALFLENQGLARLSTSVVASTPGRWNTTCHTPLLIRPLPTRKRSMPLLLPSLPPKTACPGPGRCPGLPRRPGAEPAAEL